MPQIATTTTSAAGVYKFSSLQPGVALPQLTTGFTIVVSATQVAVRDYLPTLADVVAGGIPNDR